MARLYGDKESINSQDIKNFFNKRADKTMENVLSITSYQDSEIAEKRHIEESEVLLSKLNFINKNVLDIGCGVGRWSELFHEKCSNYLGIDYSDNLIEIAKSTYKYDNCKFKNLSVSELNSLITEKPFDIVIITGVLLYLNDSEIKLLFDNLNKLISKKCKIYIRETISKLDVRITLKDFYSDELEENYNAIYRTESELLNFFKNIKNISSIDINNIHTTNNPREETEFKYFIISTG